MRNWTAFAVISAISSTGGIVGLEMAMSDWRTRWRTVELSKMLCAPSPILPIAPPPPQQLPATTALTPWQRLFLRRWIEVLHLAPDELVVFDDWFAKTPAQQEELLRDELAEWLAANPHPLVPAPRMRTFAQWIGWLRAEGFIDLWAAPGYFF
jgi:hypothetical protein